MKNEQLPTVVDLATIRTRIYNVRGKNVMIDRDLALLYQVENRALKQAVRRNPDRFPEDFMFRLTKDEYNSLIVSGVSQNVIPIRYNVGASEMFAFTEQGVAMLSAVLRSPIATVMSVNIMRAFVEMREQIINLSENTLQIENLRLELQNQKAYIEEILHDQNDCNELMQGQLDALTDSMTELSMKVNSLTQTVKKPRKPVGFVIPDNKNK
ncbi:MAG: ORF6N domain-containing protein [Bacteroidales bacterium]|nr:ORF6N domain-containing protein [Bacteroidales bacterium]